MDRDTVFTTLLNKHIQNVSSPEEHRLFFELLASGKFDHLLDSNLRSTIAMNDIPGTDMPAYVAEAMVHKILNAEKRIPSITDNKKNLRSHIVRWTVAASILVILIASGYRLFFVTQPNTQASIGGHPTNFMRAKENSSSQPLTLKTEDGSVIILSPNSKVHVPEHFDADKREVYLEGEAFFEVTQDPSRPFYVYYNNVVTHVLGTSFNVKTDRVRKVVEVSVVTGKVQVYESRNSAISASTGKQANGVILVPNQKVVYEEDKRQFTSTLVNDPVPVYTGKAGSAEAIPEFIFHKTPLEEVLRLLEKTYAIEMITENTKLNNCLFTGNIHNYNLYTKLDIICQSLNASYEINGTKILIKGVGCD